MASLGKHKVPLNIIAPKESEVSANRTEAKALDKVSYVAEEVPKISKKIHESHNEGQQEV